MLKTKFLLPAAAALLALAACSKTETIETPAPNAIGFNVLQDNALATRGTVMSTTNAETDGNSFKVWGFYTQSGTSSESQYLPVKAKDGGGYEADASGLTVSYSSTSVSDSHYANDKKWYYTGNPYYWPTYALNFYAIWPGANVVTSSEGTAPEVKIVSSVGANAKTFTYTVPTVVSKQLDVMTAYKQQQYSTSNGTNVELNFKHALSQIIFSAKTSAAYLSGQIFDVKLYNIKTGAGATYTIQTASGKEGTVSISEGTESQTPAEYDADVNGSSSFTNTVTEITKSTNELILFPQTLTDATTVGIGTVSYTAPASTDTYPYVAITYNLTDTRNSGTIFSGRTAYIPLTGKWESGKKYNYTITIDPGSDKIITFTATVSDWGTAQDVTGTIN